MKVILRENVENLGDEGELVDVKDGFGRNFLIPQGKAILATKSAIKAYRERERREAELAEKNIEEAKELAEQLSKTNITIPVKAGEDGKLFGTVTNIHVADALKDKGYDLDRRKIKINEDVNALGEYSATVDIAPEVKADVKIWVVNQSS